MTQPQLAAATGIKQPSLSELETGETKEISGPTLISISKALRVRAEWLMTGDDPAEPDPAYTLSSDERELLELYRGASNRWKVAIKYMASLRADAHQDLAAESMNVVFARIAREPVPDSKLGDRWTRPDKKR
jgi:transcriptional regulator with XRE-family HTH domain